MKKEEALKIIISGAKLYKENLENHNYLYILEDKKKNIHYFETVFLARNFLHLTGINITNLNIKSSTDFYNLCLRNKINISDFKFSSNGTTPMKLKILPQITQINKNCKIVGDYSSTKPYLFSKKIAGNVTMCLGFVKQGKYYIPNTVLKEDIRDITTNQEKVIAIFSKKVLDKKYEELTYLKKGIELEKIINEEEINKKIKIDGFYCNMA